MSRPVVGISERKLTLAELWWDLPEWGWTAVRNGFGWRYIGRRGTRGAEVSRCAELHGPTGDDWCSKWYVKEDSHHYTYDHWYLREIMALVEEGLRDG